MSEDPIIQGWCPGALRPMLSGDGWVVRVRPHLGRLSGAQATGIAALAEAHGNGLIDLSARANVQLRGVTEVSHPALVEGLRRLGLVDANLEAEARRNITVQPFWVPGDATEAVARALEAMSIEPEAPDLPGKFGVAVDCGPAPLLRAVSADIRVERAFGGLVVAADGMQTGAPVTVDEAPQAVAALMHWFLQAGGSVAGRGRMRGLVARAARPPARFATCALQGTAAPPPVPGLVAQGALVGVEFGQMQAATLAALAALGPLRVTPWRMLLIEGAQALPNLPGLITDPEDPLRPVVACTGAPGCLQGKAPVRELARKLAPHWVGGTLHLSGCAKGCAHPGPAETVLVATGAGFDLVLGGQASDVPVWRGLSAADLETNPELLHGRP